METPELLSLDPSALAWRRLVLKMANNLYLATLVGNPTLKIQAQHERMLHPKPGDFVYEQTTLWGGSAEQKEKGSGILLRIVLEPVWTYDELRAEYDEIDENTEAEIQGDLAKTQTVYYIQYGPSKEDVCRWTNGWFLVAPVGDRWF